MKNRIGQRGRRLSAVVAMGLAAVGWAAPVMLAADAPAAAPEGASAAAAVEATIVRGDLASTLPVVGGLTAHLTANLGAQVSGKVLTVAVEVGDRVDPAKTVVTLDPTFFKLDLAQQVAALKTAGERIATLTQGVATAKLDVDQAELARSDAELQMNRMKNLYEKPDGESPSISKKMYDDAVLRLKQSQLQVRAAAQRVTEAEARVAEARALQAQTEAALAYAAQRLAETEIKPPFAAVVTRKGVSPGDSVTSAPATTLLELQDLDHLDLEFNVPQEHAQVVTAGAPVRYTVPGVAGEFAATIERVLPLGDPASRSYRCRVQVDNRDGKLRPGLLVQVQLELAVKKDVVIAPTAALRPTAGGWGVRVKSAGGAVAARPVTVGLRTATAVEILTGLQPGDVVQLEVGR